MTALAPDITALESNPAPRAEKRLRKPRAAAPKQPKTKAKAKVKTDNAATRWVKDVRYGQSLSLTFFTRNAWLLVVLLVAVLSLIGLRYKTKTKMAEIKTLSHKLELAESAKLQEKANYMSLVRETEMRRLVSEKNLGLVFQEPPPFEVTLVKD